MEKDSYAFKNQNNFLAEFFLFPCHSPSCSKGALETLNPVQNEALRICTGAFRSCPVPSLLTEAGNPPLDLQREEQCLRFLTRLERNQQYAEELDVLKDHYDADFTEDCNFMVPIGTRARI